MKTLKVFSVKEFDGCGYYNHKFYLTDRSEADRYLENHKHNIVEEKDLVLFDTLDEWVQYDRDQTKARALAKLTSDERKALGF